MFVPILIAILFTVVGGLMVYGAIAYRRVGREVIWTGVAAVLLVALFAYIR